MTVSRCFSSNSVRKHPCEVKEQEEQTQAEISSLRKEQDTLHARVVDRAQSDAKRDAVFGALERVAMAGT